LFYPRDRKKIEGRIKLHKEDLHYSCPSSDVIRAIESRAEYGAGKGMCEILSEM
jgi:hypothetical protein